MEEKESKSALTVNSGVEQPPIVNPNALAQFKRKKRKPLTLTDYVEGIIAGNRTILSQAITLIESSLPEHGELAQQIIEKCLPYSGKSVRLGITGVPGVGKSTFIEAIGSQITALGHQLAVLAIDPSSERSKGSILGDKTRMESLSVDPKAFIRPSPSSGSLGGVARKTRESIILCEAAGFDVIFIETVGVGQSETAVHSMVDFFLLLMLAGAGDELQGIKRGIMEMADLIAITKADGVNAMKAKTAKIEYQGALTLFPATESGWKPKVETCSAVDNSGLMAIWENIESYVSLTQDNGYYFSRRKDQARFWMREAINSRLMRNFYNSDEVRDNLTLLENQVLDDKISSFAAANKLLSIYYKSDRG